MGEGEGQQGKIVTPDYDALWKEVIEEFFEEFLHFFAPDLYESIDFNQGYEFLEQELRLLFPDSESEKKYTDKLAKLYLKNGEEKWFLAHIEVQGYQDPNFTERMFRYFYRVYDKYNRKIFALAIFSDDSPSYRPNTYHYEFFDTTLTYRYRTYKILEQNEKDLLDSQNPFSMAVLTGLYVLRSKKNIDNRFQFKIHLIRQLLQKEWPRDKIEKLFVFMDSVMVLPEEGEKMFEAELNKILEKGEKNMGLSWDRSNLAQMYYSKGKKEGKIEGIEEGIEKGEHQKAVEIAQKMLSMGMEVDEIARVTGLSKEDLQKL